MFSSIYFEFLLNLTTGHMQETPNENMYFEAWGQNGRKSILTFDEKPGLGFA